jgi:DNA-nicking Smr family endonuclease
METIDLHGVKHEEVGSMLDTFIWDNMKRKTSAVKIITGNSEDMKKIVWDIANEYNFLVDDSWTNTGVLIMNLT